MQVAGPLPAARNGVKQTSPTINPAAAAPAGVTSGAPNALGMRAEPKVQHPQLNTPLQDRVAELEGELARQEGEHRRFADSLTSEVQRLQHVCGGAVSLRLPPSPHRKRDARVPFERDPLCTELTCALIMYGVDPSGTQTPRASPDRRELGART